MQGLIVAVVVIVIGSLLGKPPVGEPEALFDVAAGYGALPASVKAQASAAVSCEVGAALEVLGRVDRPAPAVSPGRLREIVMPSGAA
jgi:hypothetical protein